MEVTLTCGGCGSAIVLSGKTLKGVCSVCSFEQEVHFNKDHENSLLKDCPSCGEKKFYSQRDFNRKIGVILFVVAAILSIWTYGLSLVGLWLVDLYLYKKLKTIAVCYRCGAIFRGVSNINAIAPFDHETHDRTVYREGI